MSTAYDGVDYFEKTCQHLSRQRFRPLISSLVGTGISGKSFIAKAIHLVCDQICPNTIVFADTSDLVDQALLEKSELADALRDGVDARKSGLLMPDDPIIQVVFREVYQKIRKGAEEVVCVGFPRTLPQGNAYLHEELERGSFFYLEISQQNVLRNLEQRLEEGSDRHDDVDPASVRNRHKEFTDKTKPFIDQIRPRLKRRFIRIDADKRDLKKVLPVVDRLSFNGHKKKVVEALRDPYGPAGKMLYPDLHRAIKQPSPV